MGITLNREQVVRDAASARIVPEPFPEQAETTRSYPPGDGILEQEGEVTLARGAIQDVYYPVPYISPPNLTVDSPLQECALVSQKVDHFRVENTCTSGSVSAHWKAKGVKVLLAAPAGPAVPQLPPPDPVPVPSKP
jgi:hypothetical protein